MDIETLQLSQEIKELLVTTVISLCPATNAHKEFLRSHFEKVKVLQDKYPFVNFGDNSLTLRFKV